MQWTSEILNKRVKIYNRIYFNNEIEQPIYVRWSRHLYNSDSNTNAYCSSNNGMHIIMLNVSHSNVSDEMMRGILVHEMIHAWQDEHDPHCNDNWKEYKGHGPSFIKKCKELNSKFKFTYPLMRYAEEKQQFNLKKQNKDVYFVYKMTTSTVAPGIEYPIGVFIKFLYREEIVNLTNKGISVKYYPVAKFSDKIEYTDLENKYVTQTDVPVTYSRIKGCKSVEDFVMYVKDNIGLYHMVTDDDFNYADGLEIEL
jgi:hypothetical protein